MPGANVKQALVVSRIIWGALVMGSTVILGVAALLAEGFYDPELPLLWLGVAVGLMVAGIGGGIVGGRVARASLNGQPGPVKPESINMLIIARLVPAETVAAISMVLVILSGSFVPVGLAGALMVVHMAMLFPRESELAALMEPGQTPAEPGEPVGPR